MSEWTVGLCASGIKFTVGMDEHTLVTKLAVWKCSVAHTQKKETVINNIWWWGMSDPGMTSSNLS